MADLSAARAAVERARRIVVLTGAGISTDSGIPDYRGPQGVWTLDPKAEKISSLQHYLADPEVRHLAWQRRLHSPAWTAEPNVAHRAIVDLDARGVLLSVITQNIDGLHQRSGLDPHKVVEVHGTIHFSVCWSCGDRRPMQETLERVRAGDPDPSCESCSGILKSDTISFGQSLVEEVIDRAMRDAENCDLLVAVGSTLSVFPAANAVPRAKASGAGVIIVNGEQTGMDRYADHVLLGPIAELLPFVLGHDSEKT
ncbi:MAG: SIR2 family NAD-dependent protein deacylase [Ilumatobacteraceae bacterium]